MTIEIGKTYKSYGGEVVGPVMATENHWTDAYGREAAIYCPNTGYYDKNGIWLNSIPEHPDGEKYEMNLDPDPLGVIQNLPTIVAGEYGRIDVDVDGGVRFNDREITGFARLTPNEMREVIEILSQLISYEESLDED